MEKLKKIALLLMVLVFTAGFASCGDDKEDEPEGDSIVGMWKGEEDDIAGVIKTYYRYTFNSDGTYKWDAMIGDSPSVSEEGTYVISGNKLTTIPYDDYLAPSVMTFSLSGNKLTLDGEVYTRI